MAGRVISVSVIEASGPVYDLQTSPDHNFFAGNVLVHNCLFCGNPYRNRRVRRRDPEDVADELDWLRAHGVRAVFMYDDEIIDRTNLEYLLDIVSRVPGMLYRVQGRCNVDRPEDGQILKALSECGVKRIMWGVESADQKVLDAINKHLTTDQVYRSLKNAHDAGIQNFAFMMSGMPEETPESMAMTFKWAANAFDTGLIHDLQVMPCQPMPGSDLRAKAAEEGWLVEGDPLQFHVVNGTPWASQGEIAAHTSALWALSAAHKRV